MYYTILHTCIILYCIGLYYVMLYYIILCYIILYYIVLYCILFYSILLHYDILSLAPPQACGWRAARSPSSVRTLRRKPLCTSSKARTLRRKPLCTSRRPVEDTTSKASGSLPGPPWKGNLDTFLKRECTRDLYRPPWWGECGRGHPSILLCRRSQRCRTRDLFGPMGIGGENYESAGLTFQSPRNQPEQKARSSWLRCFSLRR